MKFKDKIEILTDRNTFKEIKGTVIHYKDGIVDLDLMVHMSESPWKEDTVEVSEKRTGCRLFSMSKKAPDIKPADVIKETAEFIKMKGKKVFVNRIEEQILKNPQIYVDRQN